ncbi:LuxR C-terminal-related transcriptional regulator [Agromyces subbeticus]|uniref:LuxR C-terminal-related transcriptional regulator n=1 Tax=Agromyces subbeticus TaxID=293890 RepID=UPI0003B4AEEA|nr:LuxR C-terminal-related transcriptional regulator [Agromyces subbeticus]
MRKWHSSFDRTVASSGTIADAPRIPSGLLERPRLYALLDSDAPLTVVRGVGGSGKTVLLRQWAGRSERRVIWVDIEPQSSTPEGFAVAVLQRLARGGLLPAARAHAAVDTAQTGDGPGVSLDGALSDMHAPPVIIIDKASVADESTLRSIIELLLRHPSLRVIAAANQTTQLDEPGLAFVIDRAVVSPIDLMFTQQEIRATLHISPAMAEEVHQLSGGLPVVVHALAARANTGLPRAELLAVAADSVEAFMRARITGAGYDPRIIDALTRMSLADELTIELAHDLTADDNARSILDAAADYGFGEWSEQGARRFTFIPLARELLRRELKARFPEELPRLNAALVNWRMQNGMAIAALESAVAGDDLTLATHVVKSTWFTLLRQHGTQVRGILGTVPLERLRAYPLLVMLLAICHNAVGVRRMRGLQLFALAASATKTTNGALSQSDRVFLCAAESSALRVLGFHARAIPPAQRALKAAERLSPEETGQYREQLPLIYAQLGITFYYGNEVSLALEIFSMGLALAESDHRESGFSCVAMLAGIHALNGDIPEARQSVEFVRARDWPTVLVDGYQGTFYRVAEAVIALEGLDVESAKRHVRVFAPHRATSEHWLVMARVEAMVALQAGEAATGLEKLDSSVAEHGRAGHTPRARRALSTVRMLLHLALGNPDAAREVLHRDATEANARSMVDHARLALVTGRPGDALRAAREAARFAPSSRVTTEAAVLEAVALLRTVDETHAKNAIERASALLGGRGQLLPLTLIPADDRERLTALIAAPSVSPQLTSVIQGGDAAPILTPRERLVLRALTRSASSSVIAAELSVSTNTVKTQLKSLYRKLGASNRKQAITIAIARHLLPPYPETPGTRRDADR